MRNIAQPLFIRILAEVLALSLVGPAFAQEDQAPVLEELVVYGRAAQVIGVAQSASEGIVGYGDIRLPPLLRVGELAEAVPGMVATQHAYPKGRDWWAENRYLADPAIRVIFDEGINENPNLQLERYIQ